MNGSFFFISEGIHSQRWLEAFPAAALVVDREAVKPTGPQLEQQLCWVLTTLPGWAQLVVQLVKQGATVVVLSLNESRTELLEALAAGARGYVHALASVDTLKAVATTASSGGFWLGSNFVMELIKNSSQAEYLNDESDIEHTQDMLARLTAREQEVSVLIAGGLTNKEAARKLAVTERTIKAHLGSIFEKLGVRDRLQLALLVNSQEQRATRSQNIREMIDKKIML